MSLHFSGPQIPFLRKALEVEAKMFGLALTHESAVKAENKGDTFSVLYSNTESMGGNWDLKEVKNPQSYVL